MPSRRDSVRTNPDRYESRRAVHAFHSNTYRRHIGVGLASVSRISPDNRIRDSGRPSVLSGGGLHSMSGIPFICLPLRMTSFIAFQLVVREPVLSILPVWIQRRATNIARPLMEPCVTFFVFVSLATMISACSHLIWNVFSHQGQGGT